MFDLETNRRVGDAYSSMQMPRVENKIIVIDDYSTLGGGGGGGSGSVTQVSLFPVFPSAAALTMQILKPAGFVDTAHYPLLLLV